MTELELATTPQKLYLDLLKQNLTRVGYGDTHRVLGRHGQDWKLRLLYRLLAPLLRAFHLEIARVVEYDPRGRELGLDWPAEAETMIGVRRLDHVEECTVAVIEDGVPGDLVETGVWRGGASIFMRAVLKAYGETERQVWLCDSFQGIPDPVHEADIESRVVNHDDLIVSLEEVQANFTRYGLLDDQVRFLEGWFCDTLPNAPIERIALLRLDGDQYVSTMDALTALYPKLSPGGFVVVDDYGPIKACRQAVADYRNAHGITEPILDIDGSGAFWRKA
jgi:O-methyltransferase